MSLQNQLKYNVVSIINSHADSLVLSSGHICAFANRLVFCNESIVTRASKRKPSIVGLLCQECCVVNRYQGQQQVIASHMILWDSFTSPKTKGHQFDNFVTITSNTNATGSRTIHTNEIKNYEIISFDK